MKNTIKSIIYYLFLFIIVIAILMFAQVLIAKIPKQAIEQNIKESIPFFEEKKGIERIRVRREYTFLHYYADTVLLNIIYCTDSDNALESVMWSDFYQKVYLDTNQDFIELVKEEKQANQQYLRYWHGSTIIIRPLLTIFNIKQIYALNQIIMYILAIILLILLFKKSKTLSIVYIISMVMIAFPIVPLCLEYSWTFYIMLITSIIAILIEKQGDEKLYRLFFISGILTCFFDFLTTEITTMLVPIILVLVIRKKENRLTNFKDAFMFLVKLCLLWGIAYIATWLSKWIIASIILKINAFDYVIENASLRINGLQGLESKKELYCGAIYKNWHNLYPINLEKNKKDIIRNVIIFCVLLIGTIDWKKIRNKWFSGLLLIIAIMPYVRYLVLANHSYRHAFFTFRTQIISIICIGIIILDCLNYKLLFRKIGKNIK